MEHVYHESCDARGPAWHPTLAQQPAGASESILRRLSHSAGEMDHHAAARDGDLYAFAAESIFGWTARAPEEIVTELAEARVARGIHLKPVNVFTGEHLVTRVLPRKCPDSCPSAVDVGEGNHDNCG